MASALVRATGGPGLGATHGSVRVGVEGRHAPLRLEDDVPAAATVTAVWTTARRELLPAKGDHARTAITGGYFDFDLVDHDQSLVWVGRDQGVLMWKTGFHISEEGTRDQIIVIVVVWILWMPRRSATPRRRFKFTVASGDFDRWLARSE